MTPDQLAAQLKRGLAPVYLLLGPDTYQREHCRKALIAAAKDAELVRHDLSELSLADVIDDASAMSLFSNERLIWASSAEAVVPKLETAGASDPLIRYLKSPPPGVTVVFESSRYGFDGEDKARTERVRKFYSAIPNAVELVPLDDRAARSLAAKLALDRGLKMAAPEIDCLVEALGADAARIEIEMEKLRLFLGEGGKVTAEHIASMVPDARETTIFALVAALGGGNRRKALELLDTLVREGEYLPLALSFLGSQFRQALVAQEAGLRTAQQIQGHFQRLGVAMWPSRAQQVQQTAAAFSQERLTRGLQRIFEADRAFRDFNPSERIVMEQFILDLTAA